MTDSGAEQRRWSSYGLIAPFYDRVAGLGGPRRRSIERLELRAGARVLLVGAGTGLDLVLLPGGVGAAAVDVTRAMLVRARARLPEMGALALMDGERLALRDASFDAAIVHLVLAVVPDASRCFAETARVVRRGGRIAVLGMFLGGSTLPSFVRRAIALVSRPFARDVARSLDDVALGASGLVVKRWDEPAGPLGLLRSAGFERL